MFSSNLFQEILINPPHNGANDLYVVSGYASAAMTFRHVQKLRTDGININLHLIVGMTARGGLSQANHRGFQKLVRHDFVNAFECSYILTPPPVHSKVYAWFDGKKPVAGFMGSANYSQNAFDEKQRELMTTCNAEQGLDYFQSLTGESVTCVAQEAEDFIQAFKVRYHARQKRKQAQPHNVTLSKSMLAISESDHVRVSFVSKGNIIPTRSGLNWGQRPGREQNQAYIPLKADVYNTDFFPDVAYSFTVEADDGEVLICARAQDNGKAIHTPENNSLIGKYFRKRLGVPEGELVTMNDFIKYGRIYIDFYKIDEENYYMDFSSPHLWQVPDFWRPT